MRKHITYSMLKDKPLYLRDEMRYVNHPAVFRYLLVRTISVKFLQMFT